MHLVHQHRVGDGGQVSLRGQCHHVAGHHIAHELRLRLRRARVDRIGHAHHAGPQQVALAHDAHELAIPVEHRARLGSALAALTRTGLRHLAVVDERSRCVGVVLATRLIRERQTA